MSPSRVAEARDTALLLIVHLSQCETADRNTTWKIELLASGRPIKRSLKLGPGESAEISMRLVTGEPFTAAGVAKWTDALVRIVGYANGVLVGGMSFPMEADRKGMG